MPQELILLKELKELKKLHILNGEKTFDFELKDILILQKCENLEVLKFVNIDKIIEYFDLSMLKKLRHIQFDNCKISSLEFLCNK